MIYYITLVFQYIEIYMLLFNLLIYNLFFLMIFVAYTNGTLTTSFGSIQDLSMVTFFYVFQIIKKQKLYSIS